MLCASAMHPLDLSFGLCTMCKLGVLEEMFSDAEGAQNLEFACGGIVRVSAMKGGIRARATYHDLSSAIPHKKKDKEKKERKRKRETTREMIFENFEKRKRKTCSNSHQPSFHKQKLFWS